MVAMCALPPLLSAEHETHPSSPLPQQSGITGVGRDITETTSSLWSSPSLEEDISGQQKSPGQWLRKWP